MSRPHPTTTRFGFLKSLGGGLDKMVGDHLGPAMDGNLDRLDDILFSLNLIGTNTQTDSYTLAIDDLAKMVRMDSADPNDVTVPKNADVEFPIGTSIAIRQVGAGTTTLVAGDGVTLNNPGSDLHLAKQLATVQIIKVAEDEWDIVGGTTGA